MITRRLALLAALGVTAAACGGGGASQAAQACGYVRSSLALFAASAHARQAGDLTAAHSDAGKALTDLRLALPLASQAEASDGNWQPLMTTLSESSRVPERLLVPGLQAECAGVGVSGG